jgi:hypothetical protein
VEAHGLALIFGALLRWPARRHAERYWHLAAACVHILLGAANLLFWDSFTTFHMVVPGVLATVAHGVFTVVELSAWVAGRSQS